MSLKSQNFSIIVDINSLDVLVTLVTTHMPNGSQVIYITTFL